MYNLGLKFLSLSLQKLNKGKTRFREGNYVFIQRKGGNLRGFKATVGLDTWSDLSWRSMSKAIDDSNSSGVFESTANIR